MIQLYQLDEQHYFPPPDTALAEPNGLLAYGGDLSVDRLCAAYAQGVFPWFNPGEPYLWWSPNPRAVLFCDEFHQSRSLTKLIRKNAYRITLNHAFDQVIRHCAKIPRKATAAGVEFSSSTWITENMIMAYIQFHEAGYAHSIEVWHEEELVGGLYGVSIGANFAGESMFHLHPNTSKLALAALVKHLMKYQISVIDCQLDNPHLSSLGCRNVPRGDFLDMLKVSRKQWVSEDLWQPQQISC